MDSAVKQFLEFCNERERVRVRKQSGKPRPWTADPVINKHKFTNIDRRHDRGTRLLYKLCKGLNDSRLKMVACVIYRFTGSNNAHIDRMASSDACTWFSGVSECKPIFNMSAYQAGWPPGKGTGVHFITKDLQNFFERSYKALSICRNISITLASDIMSSETKKITGKRMHFQCTEVAKDLSDQTKWVDPNSQCRMGPGARKGLKMLKHSLQSLMLDMPNNLQQPQIVEHALCEYSKYIEFKTGVRGSETKIYRPTT